MCGHPALETFVVDTWAPRAQRRLAPKTWQRDSIVYEKHIRPQLGRRRLAAIDIEDLVIWQEGREEAGVGAPTLIKAGPVVVERVRFQLLANSRRIGRGVGLAAVRDALLVSLMEMTGCRPGEALAPGARARCGRVVDVARLPVERARALVWDAAT